VTKRIGENFAICAIIFSNRRISPFVQIDTLDNVQKNIVVDQFFESFFPTEKYVFILYKNGVLGYILSD
jgi:hypothetical protein